MTKEEILEYFKDINGAYNECTRYDSLKRMLEELEQATCEDCVRREAVMDIILWYSDHNELNARQALDMIGKLPSVQPIRTNAEPCKDGTWSLKDAADALKRHGLLQRQEPCEDAISRQAVNTLVDELKVTQSDIDSILEMVGDL